MADIVSQPLTLGVGLGTSAEFSIPSRSPKRPVMNMGSKGFGPSDVVDCLFDDVSSAEFMLDGMNSPRESVFSLSRGDNRRRSNASQDSIDSIDSSAVEFFLDELLELEVCQIDDLISISRFHDENDAQEVKYVSL